MHYGPDDDPYDEETEGDDIDKPVEESELPEVTLLRDGTFRVKPMPYAEELAQWRAAFGESALRDSVATFNRMRAGLAALRAAQPGTGTWPADWREQIRGNTAPTITSLIESWLSNSEEKAVGMSTNAILAYSFDLGGGDGDWRIDEVDEYGKWVPEWRDPADEDEAIVDLVEKRLLAQKCLGVELVPYGSIVYPKYLLAAWSTTAYRGDAKMIDPYVLEGRRIFENWDGKLEDAIKVLGITPKNQPEPGVHLVSYLS